MKAEDVAKDEEDAAADCNYKGEHRAGTKMFDTIVNVLQTTYQAEEEYEEAEET